MDSVPTNLVDCSAASSGIKSQLQFGFLDFAMFNSNPQDSSLPIENAGAKRSFGEAEREKKKAKLITWKLGGKVVATSDLFSSGHLMVMPGVAAPSSSGSGTNCSTSSSGGGPLASERCVRLREKLAQMGVRHPVSVMKKIITTSDVNRGQHRLQLPNKLLDRRLLWARMSEAEEAQTREDAGLEVRVLDRLGREYELRLRLVSSLEAYRVMGRDYTRLVEANALREGQLLELLAFRLDGQLGLAVVDHEETHRNRQQQQQQEMEEAAGGGGEQQSEVMGWRRGNEMVEAALTLISMRRPLPSP